MNDYMYTLQHQYDEKLHVHTATLIWWMITCTHYNVNMMNNYMYTLQR